MSDDTKVIWTDEHLAELDAAMALVVGQTMTFALAARIVDHLLVALAAPVARAEGFPDELFENAPAHVSITGEVADDGTLHPLDSFTLTVADVAWTHPAVCDPDLGSSDD